MKSSAVSKQTALHRRWLVDCDGWTLLSGDDLHVMQERMPAGRAEIRHVHSRTRQFYYVLEGDADVEIVGITQTLGSGQGIEISPGQPHKLRNASSSPLEFLVISSGPPRADRRDLE